MKAAPRYSLGDDADDVAAMAETLDTLGLGLCAFDDEDRTLSWNRHFLLFFPEHAHHIYAGEPYAANLRRFYDVRLVDEERARIDQYIAEGIARHRRQVRPFNFVHNGRRLRVACAVLPDRRRVRIWQSLGAASTQPAGTILPTNLQRLAEHHSEGFAILDENDRIISANDEFMRLYDAFCLDDIIGKALTEIVDGVWAQRGGRRLDALLDNTRFSGAPFEVELPGDRWRRVVEHRLEHGASYSTHSDITMSKRLQRELMDARESLRRRNSELLVLAGTDQLTGVANRRTFDAFLVEVRAQAAEAGRPLALLLVDIDHFKQINDLYGHLRGDWYLRQIADEIVAAVRTPRDLVARFGGEEFAVILPDSDHATAIAVAERIRVAVATTPVEAVPNGRLPSVSIGVASFDPRDGAASAEDLIEQADQRLYRAKRNGRNRIEFE